MELSGLGLGIDRMAGVIEPLVSVIVPVYNVELYLEECLDSIREQSYKNFEVILVDDGSTDSSSDICNQYAGEDGRFKVIHQKNGGLPNARNTGIKSFSGDYATFLDSDDKLGSTYLEKLVAPLINDSTIDVALGRVVYVSFSGEHKLTSIPQKPRIIGRIEALRSLFNPEYGRWNMVAKMFRAECLRNISINEELTIGEDLDGTWKIFKNINKACYVDVEEYYYLWHPNSMTNNIVDFEGVARHTRNFIKIMNEDMTKTNPLLQQDTELRFISDFYNEFKMNFFKGNQKLEEYFYEFQKNIMKALDFIPCKLLSERIEEQFKYKYEDFLTYHYQMCEDLRNSKNVYIYGAGRNARIVAEYFKEKQIEFKCFVVSNSEEKKKAPDNEHSVICIENLKDKGEAYIFIAMILRNALDVKPSLIDIPKEKIYF